MFKLIFGILTSPLGLPINVLYEYLIMLFVGEIAYIVAYLMVGRLIGEGLLPERRMASAAHWIFRFVVYLVAWAVLRGGIELYMFLFINS